MTTLDERILAVLRAVPEPMTARQVWEKIGRQGAEGSIRVRLAELRLKGYAYRAPSDDIRAAFWRAAP